MGKEQQEEEAEEGGSGASSILSFFCTWIFDFLILRFWNLGFFNPVFSTLFIPSPLFWHFAHLPLLHHCSKMSRLTKLYYFGLDWIWSKPFLSFFSRLGFLPPFFLSRPRCFFEKSGRINRQEQTNRKPLFIHPYIPR